MRYNGPNNKLSMGSCVYEQGRACKMGAGKYAIICLRSKCSLNDMK
jgi:hypothetical protein